MRYLKLAEIVNLHLLIAKATGGASGIRDLGALESAIAQPKATFDGKDLYSSLTEKAAALCFSIVQGHPFVDGNKRTGHAAMATFLLLLIPKASNGLTFRREPRVDSFGTWIYVARGSAAATFC